MDEPGWRARHRAEKEERQHHYGGLGETKPLTDEEVAERLDVPEHSGPTGFAEPNYRPPAGVADIPGAASEQDNLQGIHTGPGPHKDDPDAHRTGFNPHLQVMCGPMLKYDTVENNVWRGFAMLVTSDPGSDYATKPVLTWHTKPHSVNSPSSVKSPFPPVQSPTTIGQHNDSIDAQFNHLSVQEDSKGVSVDGFQLHRYYALHGANTFWRFAFEIPLQEHEQSVTYSINGGRRYTFYIAAYGQNFRWVGHSCNGFSAGVKTEDFNGPSPLWTDLLNKHKEKPIHVLVGGGDQIYCDPIAREPELHEWLTSTDEKWKAACVLTDAMSFALNRFLFNHYCAWFRAGSFAKAIASIPMLNMTDDHDLIDGFGSYPDELQHSQVFSAIGERGYFWYMLFQNFYVPEVDGTSEDKTNNTYKSLIIGGRGEYIPFPSQSYLSYLGPNQAILLLDCRAERRVDRVCTEVTYNRVFDAIKKLPAEVDQLVVLLGVPIAYPRLVFAEKILSSPINPMTLLAKTGMRSMVNRFNGQPELLDDMTDHWTAEPHKKERNWLVQQCEQLAKACRLRISFLSGDVHAAACGRFHSKDKIEAELDPKYMLNIISSAIVNTPPPAAMISFLNKVAGKTHKTLHHQGIDEDMVPLFKEDTDGKKLKNSLILGRRNYVIVEHRDQGTLDFDYRVEIEQGGGTTKGYLVTAPAVKY